MSSEGSAAKKIQKDSGRVEDDLEKLRDTIALLHKHIHSLFKDIRDFCEEHFTNYTSLRKLILYKLQNHIIPFVDSMDEKQKDFRDKEIDRCIELIEKRIERVEEFISRFQKADKILKKFNNHSSINILLHEKDLLTTIKGQIESRKYIDHSTGQVPIYGFETWWDQIKNILGNNCSNLYAASVKDMSNIGNIISKIKEINGL